MRDVSRTARWGRKRWAVIAACALAAPTAHAQKGDTGKGAEPGATRVVVKTVAEEPLAGDLSSVSLERGAELVVNGTPHHVAAEDLVRITTPEVAWARNAQDVTLHLVDGGVLYGRIAGGDEETLQLETRDFGRAAIPLDAVSVILMPNAYQEAYQSTSDWLQRTDSASSGQDRVLLTNGDVLRGFVSSVSEQGIRFEGSLGETLLPPHVIVAARLASISPKSLPDRRVAVSLRSSGRFVATACRWSGERIELTMAVGPAIEVEAERLLSLDFYGGRWHWLSDQTPISVEHTPLLGLDWPYVVDRNVLGNAIRVGGETFRHGIGVHGRTRVTYDLQGRYREFVTQFGMDDDSGTLADVDVAILVDGQRSFDRQGVRRGRLHGPIRLDVSHANRVELVTDFGANGDLQDRFDWVEPALIR